jgi:hypothetical protein
MAAAGCAACFILVGCSAGSNADPAAAQSPAATSAAGTDGSGGSRAAGAPATPSTRAPRVSARSAPFQDQVRYADGISVRAGAARQDVVKATGPGQLTGKPVTLFTVVFTNRSTGPLDLTRVSVDVQYGQPPQDAAPVYDGSAQDFSTKVAPGTTAKAVYAFSIPVAELDEVTMRVRFDPEYGAATFVGRVSPPR